jgi:PKD domain-containing protein
MSKKLFALPLTIVCAVAIACLAGAPKADAIGGCFPVNDPPTAAFTWTAAPGQSISFDASGSAPGTSTLAFNWPTCDNGYPVSEPIFAYQWDFGDGQEQTESDATTIHSYASAGDHVVKLTVYTHQSSNFGDMETHTVTVVDEIAPDTTITGGPSGSTTSAMPVFTYQGSDADDTYLCDLETVGNPTFAPCPSSYTPAAPLPLGHYTFWVEARDAAGNIDPTPASRSFDVVAPPVQKKKCKKGGGRHRHRKCAKRRHRQR